MCGPNYCYLSHCASTPNTRWNYNDSYEDLVGELPADRQQEAREKLCASAKKKAEALGIASALLLPGCFE